MAGTKANIEIKRDYVRFLCFYVPMWFKIGWLRVLSLAGRNDRSNPLLILTITGGLLPDKIGTGREWQATLGFYSLAMTILLTSSLACAQTPLLLKGHSHNDYLHKRPLLDAFDNGFFSVEADIYYEDGNFIVAHIKTGIRKRNTLERLYLIPFWERVNVNKGKVYAEGPLEFELMFDLKGGWSSNQIDSLEHLVMRYEELFTVYEHGIKTARAVKIVLSGGNGNYKAANQNPRYFSLDGSLDDFNSPLDSTIICRTSASYKSHFKWRGKGEMPDAERKQLREYVAQAHATGRKIRFWAATNRSKVWKELLDAGVDWVNVDKLEKFRKFYTTH